MGSGSVRSPGIWVTGGWELLSVCSGRQVQALPAVSTDIHTAELSPLSLRGSSSEGSDCEVSRFNSQDTHGS